MPHDTEDRLSAALNRLVSDRRYIPDIDQIEQRGLKLRRRRLRWRATATGSFAVATVAAVAVATSSTGSQTTAPGYAAPEAATAATAEDAPLVQLVGQLSTVKAPAGDATLVLRDQVFRDGSQVDVWDLTADNGDYYFAQTRDALPAQVKGGHTYKDGVDRKKAVAAAKYAAKGNLDKARRQMAIAALPADPEVEPTFEAPGAPPPPLTAQVKEKLKLTGGKYVPVNKTDFQVWNNSLDALRNGAGSPAVRAGVLRLLGQLPEVKVTKESLGGQPVLTLAASPLATNAQDGTDETLTVNADNGLPISFTVSDLTINYTVTRVTIADVAMGRF